jgi:hypothetical protein
MLDLKFVRENPDDRGKAMKDKGEEGQTSRSFCAWKRCAGNYFPGGAVERAAATAFPRKLPAEKRQAGLTRDDHWPCARFRLTSRPWMKKSAGGRSHGRALLNFPNIPLEGVPVGHSEEENVPVRHVGDPPLRFYPQGPLGHGPGPGDFGL